jgi:carbon storage regulator
MLILSRRSRQTVVIAGRVRVTVMVIAANHVELGIEAPPHIAVDREEIHLRKRDAARVRRRQSTGAVARESGGTR